MSIAILLLSNYLTTLLDFETNQNTKTFHHFSNLRVQYIITLCLKLTHPKKNNSKSAIINIMYL